MIDWSCGEGDLCTWSSQRDIMIFILPEWYKKGCELHVLVLGAKQPKFLATTYTRRQLDPGQHYSIMRISWSSITVGALANAGTLVAAASSLPASEFPPSVAVFDENYVSCASANWPPPGPGDNAGTVLKPQVPDKELQAALAEVSPERIKNIIAKLVSFGTRHTLSSQDDPERGVGAAREWIASEFRRFAEESDGTMEVAVEGYIQGPAERVPEPVKISNVKATLKGTSDPSRHYVTMGHYDTRASDPMNWWIDQPGANDDASGVAGKSDHVHACR